VLVFGGDKWALFGDASVAKQIDANQYARVETPKDWSIGGAKDTVVFEQSWDSLLTIESTDFTDSYFYMDLDCESSTKYEIIADVWSDAEIKNSASGWANGAQVGFDNANSMNAYQYAMGGWQVLGYNFVTKDTQTSLRAYLRQGWNSTVLGKSIFKNIKIVKKANEQMSTDWKILCLILKNVDANIVVNGETRNVKVAMSDLDVEVAQTAYAQFVERTNRIANGQIHIGIDVQVVETPIPTLTAFGSADFWASPRDIYPVAAPLMREGGYDHIFSFVRISDAEDVEHSAPCDSYSGLGGTQFNGVGYSQARLPAERDDWWYTKRDAWTPTHEFTHTLERQSRERGIAVPVLDSQRDYWYIDEQDGEFHGFSISTDQTPGLQERWFADYYHGRVWDKDQSEQIGCTPESFETPKYDETTLYNLEQITGPFLPIEPPPLQELPGLGPVDPQEPGILDPVAPSDHTKNTPWLGIGILAGVGLLGTGIVVGIVLTIAKKSKGNAPKR